MYIYYSAYSIMVVGIYYTDYWLFLTSAQQDTYLLLDRFFFFETTP